MSLITLKNRTSPFNTFFDDITLGRHQNKNWHNAPLTNIIKTESGSRVELVLPGFDKKNITIDIKNNELVIEANLNEENSDSHDNYSRRDHVQQSLKKNFTLPKSVKIDDIKASYENGILVIDVPVKKDKAAEISKSIKIG